MVGPGKLMVGTGPSRPGSGYATATDINLQSSELLPDWVMLFVTN